jgi:4a-hydroxytetrahydrobiopterin dehydratase
MSEITKDLAQKKCQACSGPDGKLSRARIVELLDALPGWEEADDQISRTFSFKNYYETMAFVNALAWISHRQDHHPDIELGYNKARVKYSTHSVGGLSENDFICAAKLEMLFAM